MKVSMASLMLGLSIALAYNAQAAATLDGVWQVNKPITQLKTKDGKAPPLLPAAQKVYAERSAQYKKGDRSFDSTM